MTETRISRVLQVLALVAFNPRPTRLKDIGRQLELHPSTVSRIVAELCGAGLITKCAYRSVIGTPALAVLGSAAGKNHPLSAIAAEVLPPLLNEYQLSGEFAAAAPGGLWHFYQLTRGTPPPEPLWRSDLAAVIYAASREPWEEVRSKLAAAAPAGHDPEFGEFRERYLEAQTNNMLINFHSGRFRQLTLPVRCGDMVCALSVAGAAAFDREKVLFECSRTAVKIRSLYEKITDSDA